MAQLLLEVPSTHHDLGIAVVVAIVALLALVIAFIQILWVSRGRARIGLRRGPHRGRHRR